MIKNILIAVLLLIIAAGVYWWYQSQPTSAKNEKDEVELTTTTDALVEKNLTITEEGESMLGETTELVYQGKKLAGQESPFLEFTPEDYAAAKLSDKLLVLFFYTNWLPASQTEAAAAEDAFDELANPKVIGFRINFEDNETSEAERALATELSVTNQQNKIFVRGGSVISQTADSWDKARFLTEINQVFNN